MKSTPAVSTLLAALLAVHLFLPAAQGYLKAQLSLAQLYERMAAEKK